MTSLELRILVVPIPLASLLFINNLNHRFAFLVFLLFCLAFSFHFKTRT